MKNTDDNAKLPQIALRAKRILESNRAPLNQFLDAVAIRKTNRAQPRSRISRAARRKVFKAGIERLGNALDDLRK